MIENECKLSEENFWKLNSLIQLMSLNPLSANPTKWSNTLKQFVGNLPMNCLSVFDQFVKLVLKGLNIFYNKRDLSLFYFHVKNWALKLKIQFIHFKVMVSFYTPSKHQAFLFSCDEVVVVRLSVFVLRQFFFLWRCFNRSKRQQVNSKQEMVSKINFCAMDGQI